MHIYGIQLLYVTGTECHLDDHQVPKYQSLPCQSSTEAPVQMVFTIDTSVLEDHPCESQYYSHIW